MSVHLDLDNRTATMVATACLAIAGEDSTPDDVRDLLNATVDEITDQLGTEGRPS